MLSFVTLFDKNYLSRGLVLLKSLKKNCRDIFTLYVLAMDDDVKKYFDSNSIKGVVCFSVEDMITYYPVLKKLRNERTRGEFCWTLSSFSIQYVLKVYNEDVCIYVDSDICFWSNPELLISEMGSSSVLITEHNYFYEYDTSYTRGKYCVQFMCFRNDQAGNEILEWWRSNCEEWCYDRIEENRFGDQKYLDDWENRFEGKVYNCKNLGCGLAPWNNQKYNLINIDGHYYVEDKISHVKNELVFYHFHNLHKLKNSKWSLSNYRLDSSIIPLYKKYIYRITNEENKLPEFLRSKEDDIKDLKEKLKLPRCIYGGFKYVFFLFKKISEVENNVISFNYSNRE